MNTALLIICVLAVLACTFIDDGTDGDKNLQ